MAVPIGVARLRHRHEGLDAVLGQRFDVVELGEAAVGELLAVVCRTARASFIGNILPMSEPMLSTDTPAMAVLLVSVANWTL
jgi:hypothetical protein